MLGAVSTENRKSPSPDSLYIQKLRTIPRTEKKSEYKFGTRTSPTTTVIPETGKPEVTCQIYRLSRTKHLTLEICPRKTLLTARSANSKISKAISAGNPSKTQPLITRRRTSPFPKTSASTSTSTPSTSIGKRNRGALSFYRFEEPISAASINVCVIIPVPIGNAHRILL